MQGLNIKQNIEKNPISLLGVTEILLKFRLTRLYLPSISSFDLRSSAGQHWKDSEVLGERGYVYYEETPHSCRSSLNVEPVKAGDSGQYRCRVDYETSPTRNTRIKLKLVGERADRGEEEYYHVITIPLQPAPPDRSYTARPGLSWHRGRRQSSRARP